MKTEKLKILYDEQMTSAFIEEFEKKIYYISEKIVDFNRVCENQSVVGVELTMQGDFDEKDIRMRVSDILNNEIVGLRNIKMDRVWKDDYSSANSEKVLEECIAKKMVLVPADGQVAFKEPLVGLFDFFDSVFKTISMKLFACENYRFPTLLKTSTLKKVGYFESFPNLLMFVTRLKNEISNYHAFKNEFNADDDDEKITRELMDYCCNTDFGLPPTMCYYVYEMLSDQTVHNNAFTARGKSFRYENKYQKPFERLWDFTIRETVFIGEQSFVADRVESYRSYAIEFMKLLNLKGLCETANDPFFLVDDASKRINIQKMLGSKYELRLRINPKSTMAIGSFNIHGQFLAKRFHLLLDSKEQEYCHTGCIGIGLERLLFGFLSQYGCDEASWPPIVKDCIANPTSVNTIIQQLKTA